MFRLTSGELPGVKMPRLVAVMVGTNDLGWANSANPDGGEAPVLQEVGPTMQRWAGKLIFPAGLKAPDLPDEFAHTCWLVTGVAHRLVCCCRVGVLVNYLLDKLPSTTNIALLGLLPRGKGSHVQPSVFTPAINSMNEQLK